MNQKNKQEFSLKNLSKVIVYYNNDVDIQNVIKEQVDGSNILILMVNQGEAE